MPSLLPEESVLAAKLRVGLQKQGFTRVLEKRKAPAYTARVRNNASVSGFHL